MTKLSPALFVAFVLLAGCEWFDPDSETSSLIDLSISGAQLVPDFSPEITDYVAELTSPTDTVTVTAVATNRKATVLVNGRPYEFDEPGIEVQVDSGTSEITIIVRSEDEDHVTIYSVVITQTVSTYSVGGTVSGLAGSVTLQNNGGDDLVVSDNGAFTFATALVDGSTYNVEVSSQPSGQSCSVNNGVGTIASANVTNISVTCVVPTYTVGGTVSPHP